MLSAASVHHELLKKDSSNIFDPKLGLSSHLIWHVFPGKHPTLNQECGLDASHTNIMH